MNFLMSKETQLTTMQLYIRWTVESVNSMIKKWKALDQKFSNSQIPNIGKYVRIVSALCNAYRPPRVFDKTSDTADAERIKNRLSLLNELQERVEANRYDTRSVIYKKIDAETLEDFPRLSLNELKDLTLGVYQVSSFFDQEYIYKEANTK